MEKDDLSITTTNANLIIGDCLNTFNSLSANILSKDHDLVLDLETAEITTLSTGKEKFF
jgi:hypothetical protein